MNPEQEPGFEPTKLTEDNLTAKEAAVLSKQTPITLSAILTNVKSTALNGGTFIRQFDVSYTTDIQLQLLKLGYTLNISKGPIGEEIIKISW